MHGAHTKALSLWKGLHIDFIDEWSVAINDPHILNADHQNL